MKRYTYVCNNCGKQFESSWRRNKDANTYCSSSCAAIHNSKNRKQSSSTRSKISSSLKSYYQNNPHVVNYICSKCGCEFSKPKSIKKGRNIYCDNCKRHVIHARDPKTVNSVKELSSRTVSKLLKRCGVGCAICGWSEASCDIHHIVSKKSGGTDDHSNLVVLCPNCHRKVHSGDPTLTPELLTRFNIDITCKDILSCYNPKAT